MVNWKLQCLFLPLYYNDFNDYTMHHKKGKKIDFFRTENYFWTKIDLQFKDTGTTIWEVCLLSKHAKHLSMLDILPQLSLELNDTYKEY